MISGACAVAADRRDAVSGVLLHVLSTESIRKRGMRTMLTFCGGAGG